MVKLRPTGVIMNVYDGIKRNVTEDEIKQQSLNECLTGVTRVYGGSREIQTKTPSYLREKRSANTWNDKVKLATYYPKHGLPREMIGGKHEIQENKYD